MNDYRFNKERHIHEICIEGEWKALTGITTILQILAKPALIQWAANMAVDYICEHIKELITGTKEEQELVLKEAKSAHRKKKEEAGQKGTDIHEIIEKEIKEAIEKNEGIISEFKFGREELPQIQHFVKWAVDNKVKFKECEKHLYSKEMFLGGIVDFVCEIDGKVWIGDLKTGSGIYPEHFAQMAGYQLMLNEMELYKDIAGHVVLNLKKDGSFQEKRSISLEDYRKFFLACLEIYRTQEKIKGSIIN